MQPAYGPLSMALLDESLISLPARSLAPRSHRLRSQELISIVDETDLGTKVTVPIDERDFVLQSLQVAEIVEEEAQVYLAATSRQHQVRVAM